MKKKRSNLIGLLLSFTLLLTGCTPLMTLTSAQRMPSTESAVPLNEPKQFSSLTGSVITPEPTATPEPTPEPVPETVTAGIDKLDFGSGYMQPKSLDGIDPFQDKVIALTFDDGPTGDTTPQLLDILRANDVNATFFMVGANAASNPEVVRRAYEEGNEIGTHSWNHEKNFLKWSLDEVMDQISRANDAIAGATGLRTIIDRPPEGAINAEVAENIGRMQIMWNVDPNDWKHENRDPDIVYNNVINGGIYDGALVLSHDIRPTTVEAYDRIIKELKNQGYKLVTITQLIQIAQIRGKEIGYVFNGSPSAASAAEAAAETEAAGEEAASSEEES